MNVQTQLARVLLSSGPGDLHAHLLSVIIAASNSSYGVMGHLDEQGALICRALSVSEREGASEGSAATVFQPAQWRGVWGRALRRRQAQCHNQPAGISSFADEFIHRCCALPVVHEHELLGLIYVANKQSDYTADDEKLLHDASAYLAPLLAARLDLERHGLQPIPVRQDRQTRDRTREPITRRPIEMFFATDLEFRLTYAAPAAARLLGTDPSKLVGMHVREAFPEASEIAMGHSDVENWQQEWPTIVGQRFTFSRSDHAYSARLLPYSEGFMAYVEPVTADEETQRKLKETALSLEAVVEHANSIILRWDRNHRIIYFNSFAEKFFGYSQDEVIGQPIQCILAQLDGSEREADDLPDAIVRHPERFIHNDNENITKDGRRVWIRWTNKAIFDHNDELQEILAIGNDITDRKKLELQLLKTHEELEQRVRRRTRELGAAKEELEHLVTELAEKNEELERFTYTVSHDLRSPLITIQTFAEMVQEDASSGQIDHIVQDAKRIVVASEKMMGLLDGLLELSRIGRFMNPPEAVPFLEIVEDALVMMAGQLAEHGAQVDVRDDLPTVWGDRRRLVQVMQNLLDNAVKFRTSDAPPRIEIGVAPDRDSQALFVKDNGIGIETDDRTRIFGLFKKLTAETSGVGVGLALVARIIAFHEGEIWVESEGKGKGSTFFFTIPSPP